MKKKLLRVVKMSLYYSLFGILLQCLVVSLLFASPSEGQELKDIRVDVALYDVSFEEALKSLERSTSFKFLYVNKDVPIDEKITIDVTDESLYDLLEGLAGQYNLVFQRINNQIVIKKANFEEYNEPVVVIQQTGSIRGKVTDAKTGESLMGANIILKETGTGVAANENGEYSLEKLSPGNYTLVIKYIGYSTKEETVDVVENKTVEINIELDPSAYDLNEVVVTGTMVETKKKTMGTAITVLKEKDIETMSTTSIAAMFQDQQVAGVSSMDMSGDDMNNKIFIRGANTALTTQIDPIKILIDGVEVQTRFISNISAQNIERIEIIRGPQASTLYGSEAAGGVIQIFTKKGMVGQEGIKGSISTQQGVIQSKYDLSTLWSRSYNGSVSGGLLGGSYGLGIAYTQKEGYCVNNDRENFNASFGFQKKLLDNLNISVISRLSNRKWGYAGSSSIWYGLYQEGKLPTANSYLLDPDNYYTSSNIVLGLNISYVYSDWWEHQLTIGYIKNRYDRYTVPSNLYASDTTRSFVSSDYIRPTFRYSTNITLPRMDFFQPSITAGFEYIETEYKYVTSNYRNVSNYTVSTLSGNIIIDNTAKRAFFGQAKLGFYDKLFITAGVRTDYNSNNGSNYSAYTTNPRVGFSYLMEPMNGWVIKTRGSWGTGIQSPTLLMRNGSLPNCLPNPDIGPQTTSGWEIGVDQYFLDGALYCEFTYYYQDTKDQLGTNYPDLENNPSQYQILNLGEVENKGLEAVLKYTKGAMDVSVNVSYNHNEIIEMPVVKSPTEIVGKPIAASIVPQVTAGFSFNYRLNELLNIDKEHNTSIGFNVNYIGKRWALDYEAYYTAVMNKTAQSRSNYLKWFDGFAKVNLFANYKLTRNLGIGLNIRNLFNSYEQPTPYYYVTGRETSLQLNMNF
ncbi:MAG: TonB-dependent receptor [Ignavibacteria bacterium]|jgi:outer membrane receptor protein involved in Fe transport